MNSSLHLQILANEAAHRYCADNACKFASTAPPGQREDEASPDSMSATGGTSSVDVSIRNYLAEIYPAGRWFDRTAVPPARARSFFRSLQWFYNTTAAPLPMDALKGSFRPYLGRACRLFVSCTPASAADLFQV